MSEHLQVSAHLSATEDASPVINGLLADIRKLESSIKRLNGRLAGMGQSGTSSMTSFNQAIKNAAAQMQGLANTSQTASQNYSNNLRVATQQRLKGSRHLYSELAQMERQHQSQVAAGRRAERAASRSSATSGNFGRGTAGRHAGGVSAGLRAPPLPAASSTIIAGLAGGLAVGSAIKKRIEVQAAETRAEIFGELSKVEVEALRKSYADRAGIKYGAGTTKAVDAAVEGLKAGVSKQFAGQFGELILQAQAGLDIDTAATAQFAGRLATLQGGFNYAAMKSVMNAAAVANNATAANGNEIIEATRRSLSALTSTKMTPEQLVGINATGISLGIQPFKMGTFVSFLTSELASANSARGQRAKDLEAAARALGFGGRVGMANSMRNSPLETIQNILDRLAKLPETMRAKVARQIGMREWSDEILSLVPGRDKLREVQADIQNKPRFLDGTSLKKIKSLQGRWATITAAAGILWEKVGAGWDTMFVQISDAIIRHADAFNWDAIRDRMAGFVDGLRDGFGLKTWGELIDRAANWFKPANIEQWRDFAKGFADGMGDFASGLKTAFTALSFLTTGGGDAKNLGRTTAYVVGVVAGLSLLAPAIVTMVALAGAFRLLAASPVGRLVTAFAALTGGLHQLLSAVSDKIFNVFTSIVDAIKGVALDAINKVRGWMRLSPIGGGTPSSSSQSHGATGSWSSPGASGAWSPTSKKVRQSFSPANYRGGSTIDGVINPTEYAKLFAGSSLSGSQADIEAAAKREDIPASLLASVIAHETGRGRNVSGNNVAGLMNPDTGYRTKQGFATMGDGINAAARVVAKNWRRSGGDLDKMGAIYAPLGAANDPTGLNRNWPKAVSGYRNQLATGNGGSTGIIAGGGDGAAALKIAEGYAGLNEYRDTAKLAGFMGGRDPRGAANAWCAAFVNSSLKAVGGKGTGSAVANSFQRWGQAVNAATVQAGDIMVETGGYGPNQTGGHVGFATGKTRTGKDGRLQLEMFGGNQSDGAGYKWTNSDRNLMIRRGTLGAIVPAPTQNVPQSNIQNVPTAPGTTQHDGLMRARIGGTGTTNIYINGNQHDPEALATLVQRRIDEQHNYRLHDTDASMV